MSAALEGLSEQQVNKGLKSSFPHWPLSILMLKRSSVHFTLYQWVLQVEWLKFLSWKRGRVKLKFVFVAVAPVQT